MAPLNLQTKCISLLTSQGSLAQHAPPNWVRGQVTTGHAAWSEVQITILMDSSMTPSTSILQGHTFKISPFFLQTLILPVSMSGMRRVLKRPLPCVNQKYNGDACFIQSATNFISYIMLQLAARWKEPQQSNIKRASGL